MHESIVESVKAIISPKFIKAQHFKHYGKRLYKERNNIYYAHLHLLWDIKQLLMLKHSILGMSVMDLVVII